MADVFMGAVGFCDDLLLLAPTRDGLQVMLDICQRFAAKYNLKFSTDPNPVKSKTKCIFVCGKSKNVQRPAPLFLDGKELPLLDSAVHLGNVLHESGTMDKDVKVKRAAFIRERPLGLPALPKSSEQSNCMLVATMAAISGTWEVTVLVSTSPHGGPVSSWHGSYQDRLTLTLLTIFSALG